MSGEPASPWDKYDKLAQKERERVKNWPSVQFGYPGSQSVQLPGVDDLADEACLNANAAITTALKKAGINSEHEYSWPDGSLYRLVDLQDLTKREVIETINRALVNAEIEYLSAGKNVPFYSVIIPRHVRMPKDKCDKL